MDFQIKFPCFPKFRGKPTGSFKLKKTRHHDYFLNLESR